MPTATTIRKIHEPRKAEPTMDPTTITGDPDGEPTVELPRADQGETVDALPAPTPGTAVTAEPAGTATRHPLLERQLEHCAIEESPTAEQWHDFVDRVGRSYHDADRSQTLLESSIEQSTREFQARLEALQAETEHVLTGERHRLQLVFDSVTTALVVIERSGRISAVNPAAQRLLGDPSTLVDRPLDDALLMVGRDGAPRPMLATTELDDVLLSGTWGRTDVRLVNAAGRALMDAGDPVTSEHLVAADVSIVPFTQDDLCVGGLVLVTDNAEREAARERLAWQASHDPLTGLVNRAVVTERIELALVGARRSGAWPSVLFCDLDRFKHINDSFGHGAGDKLLTVAAERLLRCVRSIDTVARLGGDEFVILCESAGDTELVKGIAERILEALMEPFEVSDERTHVSVSIGVAHAGPQHTSADSLLHEADLAMYRAKERGRNCFDVADEGLRVNAAERVLLERGLRSAIARRELSVAYQPVKRADTDELVGFEALARWVHPVLGVVRPDRFVPVAEETGLIQALGDRMLDLACRDVATWNRERLEQGLDPLTVHVNISGRDLQSPHLLARVRDALRRHDVPPHWLVLEMTETMLLDDPDKALDRLRELKLAGIRVAIDDFGTGYSSLAYLRRYPVHMVKIDREFVAEIAASTQDQCIVQAMVDLARGLDYVVLAEGVETNAELEVLRRLGCQMVQGYLIGRPMPSEDALLLATSSGRQAPIDADDAAAADADADADETVSFRTESPDPVPSASV
jgi:diguanylate cyclase (GGDEF)-like protein